MAWRKKDEINFHKKKLKKKYSQRWIVVGGGGQEAFCSRPIRIEINFFVLHQSGRRSIPKTHNLLSTSHHTPQSHTWSQSQIICPVLWSRYTRTDQVAKKVFMISNLFSTIWHWDLWWWGVSRWGGRNWMEWWWMDWGWDPPKMDRFSPSCRKKIEKKLEKSWKKVEKSWKK